MELPLSHAVVSQLEVLDHTGSTNDELVGRASTLPDFSVLMTTDQRTGRGRLGRSWVAPRGTALAASVLLRPRLPAGEALGLERYGWLPLIAGVAMARAVASIVPSGDERVGLKWPNDVQVDGAKISGLLGELLPTGDGVVMGAGLNLTMTREQLPVPTATSLALTGTDLGVDALADAALAGWLTNLRELYDSFVRLGGDADASGARDAVLDACTTLGQEVRVQLPGADDLLGIATDVDRAGRLVVRRSQDGHSVAVAAGDVTHVRYE